MTYDFSPRPKGFGTPSARTSFDEVAGELLERAESVVAHLLPHGRREGHEYKVGGIGGERGDSLSINLREGVWKDFATDDGGGDLISLWAAVKGLRMVEAKEDAERWLGKAPPPPARPAWASAMTQTVVPLPAKPKGPEPDHKWAYRTADGALWCWVHRNDTPQGKEVRPVLPNGSLGKPKGLAPLLNLPEILAEPGATVVLVEGEKCVDAISALTMQGIVPTTHIGGAQGVAHTDWAPLRGRHVVRWPDKDKAGEKWMTTTRELLEQAGVASLRDVTPDPGWPDKHDAADLPVDVRRAVLAGALGAAPVAARLKIADSHFDVAWDEPEPEREYLIQNLIPFGRGGILAAPGDTGKGMLILDLAAKVASPPIEGFDANPPTAFGHPVLRHGRVVILSAEDDRPELRRRLRTLAPDLPAEVRARIHFLPYPDMEGRLPVYMRDDRGMPVYTPEYDAVVAELKEFDDLALVIMDPISAFFFLDMTTNAASQVVGNTIDKLAKTLGCTVLGLHHLTKGDKNTPIQTVQDARRAIQGGGQLLNSIRFAYALWAPIESVQKSDLAKAGRRVSENNAVFRGAVVKANYPAARDIEAFIRNPKTGLLEHVPRPVDPPEERIAGIPVSIVNMLEVAVRHFAEQGRPAKLGQIGYPYNTRAPKHARGEWMPLMPKRWQERPWRKGKYGGERFEIINTLISEKRIACTDGYLHMPDDEWGKSKSLEHDIKSGSPLAVQLVDLEDDE